MGLALSTSWNASRLTDIKTLLFEIAETGFRELELSFNLTRAMVKEIRQAAGEYRLNIVSLHNFCPIPEGMAREIALPDCYSMSSQDTQERLLAVEYTKRGIDTARSLGAKAVVLHCGRVEIPDRTRDLIGIYEKGQADTEEFKRLKDEMAAERQSHKGPFLEKTLESLAVLDSYAQKQGVCLGVENRFYYREIPAIEEIGIILDKFSNSSLFYWHDAGHAQVMENLGFAQHKQYLDLYAGKMIGIHLHDLIGCLDHLAPGKGKFDFSLLKPYLKKETIKVVEAHYPATAQEVKESREFLEKVYAGVA